MNTPTPITAAHLALVRDMAAQGQYLSRSIEHYAQEIADSEARATAAIRAEVERLRSDRDCEKRLRKNADEDRENALTRAERVAAQLHALCLICGTSDANKFETWVDRANARAEKAEAEVERLRSDRDCEKRLRKDADEFRENAIARAERAEAELAKERAMLDWLQAQEVKRGIEAGIRHNDECPFLVLGEDGTTYWGNTYREAIAAAMKGDAPK